MARVNFVVPQLLRDSFSGGIWCVLEYAHGLVARGHEVTIVPIMPSEYPAWFPHAIGNVVTSTLQERLNSSLKSIARAGLSSLSGRSSLKTNIKGAVEKLCLVRPHLFNDLVRSGIAESYVLDIAPEADITVASSCHTIRPAALLTGKKVYFAMHYEPYLNVECANPVFAEAIARQSLRLGFQLIANSSWLRNKLLSESGDGSVSLCVNAIDHKIFNGEPKTGSLSRRIAVISYGGRKAVWKGFEEMAKAVAIARAALPDYEIEWRVYGGARIAPDEITPYIDLGFLSPSQLSEEYRKADILLSASWYESFPLFPIEAMACGLPVVTTQFGTEDYAMHERTAEVVEARSPESIAHGLIRLIQNPDYRSRIAIAGNQIARDFRWERSVERFESILLNCRQ